MANLPEELPFGVEVTDEDFRIAEGLSLQGIAKLVAVNREAQAKFLEYKFDFLTGVFDRRALTEETKHLFDLVREPRRDIDPTAALVVVLDIKDFKEFNELKGHPEGDEVLKETANFLKTVSRFEEGHDIVGRLGGDEFVMIIGFRVINILPQDLINTINQRLHDRPLDKFPKLPKLKWNYNLFLPRDNIESLFNISDVKGKPETLPYEHI